MCINFELRETLNVPTGGFRCENFLKFINYFMLFNCFLLCAQRTHILYCIKFITNQHEACTFAKLQQRKKIVSQCT